MDSAERARLGREAAKLLWLQRDSQNPGAQFPGSSCSWVGECGRHGQLRRRGSSRVEFIEAAGCPGSAPCRRAFGGMIRRRDRSYSARQAPDHCVAGLQDLRGERLEMGCRLANGRLRRKVAGAPARRAQPGKRKALNLLIPLTSGARGHQAPSTRRQAGRTVFRLRSPAGIRLTPLAYVLFYTPKHIEWEDCQGCQDAQRRWSSGQATEDRGPRTRRQPWFRS